MVSYTIKQQHYEGPLEVLLELIEKRKLFINDISLAQVTDDYIAYIQGMETKDLGDISSFILIASTLLLIKSKSLLPSLTLTEEETADTEDLERRLKAYSLIKNQSLILKEKFGAEPTFTRSHIERINVFAPHSSITTNRMIETLRNILARIPKTETIPQATLKKVVSLEEMIDTLSRRVTEKLKMTFKDFSAEHKGEKVNVIVSFLALLELVKQGVVEANQHNHTTDIHIETKNVGTPRYM
jgi:segregation and condensation protein A